MHVCKYPPQMSWYGQAEGAEPCKESHCSAAQGRIPDSTMPFISCQRLTAPNNCRRSLPTATVANWHQGWQADHNLPLRARHLLMQHQASAREYGQRGPSGSLAPQALSYTSIQMSGGCCVWARMLRWQHTCRLKHDLPSVSRHLG